MVSLHDKTVNTIRETFWRQAILPVDSTIEQVIRNLDQVAIKIVLVVDKANKLQGTISDGDIRRGLLRGLHFSSPIASVIHRNALVVSPEIALETVMQLMIINKIQQIPVVDERQQLIGLHLWDDIAIPLKRSNLMVIMAGGQGIRLRPYTEKCPKPLLSIGGKPILEHIIERARAEGFQKFVLAIHYLGHMIEDYFGDGSRWKVEINYLREESPLGTIGAIGLMNPRPDASFLVCNGDVLTDIRYGELLNFHLLNSASATMAVRLYEWQNPFGVVRTKGVDIIGFEEKPLTRSYVNAGIYALEPNVIDALRANEYCDMPTLLCRLQESAARTIVYPMHEPWLDVGRPDDLEGARRNNAGAPDETTAPHFSK